MLRRIFAQSGNRLVFVTEEEGVAKATHILREAYSRMEVRVAVEAISWQIARRTASH
jgi:hypothetical protein